MVIYRAAVQSSSLEIGLAGKGTFRWVVADLTLALEEARRRLDMSPLAAVALGRALVGAVLLLRLSFKVPARLILELRGNGPLGLVRAEVDHLGRVRGTVGNPRVQGAEDDFSVAEALGKGSLFVTRETRGSGAARYTSQVALVSGELGDDLTHFLEQSQQIRSAVLLGVLPVPIGIAAAGGLIVEALPGTEESDLAKLERNIHSLEGVSSYLSSGGMPRLLAATFAGFDVEVLEKRPLEYSCSCNRGRLLDLLRQLEPEEIEEMKVQTGNCEAVCSYCGNRYFYDPEELSAGPASGLADAANEL